MSEAEFLCKSRDQGPRWPGKDHWRTEPNGDRTCSFCGSLHPDDFEKLLAEGADPRSDTKIDPSTKGYKWYVHRSEIKNASEGGIKFYNWHVPDEAAAERMNALLKPAIEASRVKFAALSDALFRQAN